MPKITKLLKINFIKKTLKENFPIATIEVSSTTVKNSWKCIDSGGCYFGVPDKEPLSQWMANWHKKCTQV